MLKCMQLESCHVICMFVPIIGFERNFCFIFKWAYSRALLSPVNHVCGIFSHPLLQVSIINNFLRHYFCLCLVFTFKKSENSKIKNQMVVLKNNDNYSNCYPQKKSPWLTQIHSTDKSIFQMYSKHVRHVALAYYGK